MQVATTGKGRLLMVAVFALILLGIGAYKYRNLLTPATVNGQPVYVWNYFWKLHTQFGQDQLNSMTTELMIRQAVAESKISIPKSDVDAEVKIVEQEASSSGGLAMVLESQRLTMDEFRTRVELQLAVKKILAEKIQVTAQEIDETYKKNKDFYKGLSETAAKEEVKKQLEDQKFQTEVSKWLSDVRSKAKVVIDFPGVAPLK